MQQIMAASKCPVVVPSSDDSNDEITIWGQSTDLSSGLTEVMQHANSKYIHEFPYPRSYVYFPQSGKSISYDKTLKDKNSGVAAFLPTITQDRLSYGIDLVGEKPDIDSAVCRVSKAIGKTLWGDPRHHNRLVLVLSLGRIPLSESSIIIFRLNMLIFLDLESNNSVVSHGVWCNKHERPRNWITEANCASKSSNIKVLSRSRRINNRLTIESARLLKQEEDVPDCSKFNQGVCVVQYFVPMRIRSSRRGRLPELADGRGRVAQQAQSIGSEISTKEMSNLRIGWVLRCWCIWINCSNNKGTLTLRVPQSESRGTGGRWIIPQ